VSYITDVGIESFLKCKTAIEEVGKAIDDERKIVPEASNPKANRLHKSSKLRLAHLLFGCALWSRSG
jgi:hypothetical protein